MKTPKTLIFGGTPPDLPHLTCTWLWYATDKDVYALMASEAPDVLVSCGRSSLDFQVLCSLPLTQRQRWVHVAHADELTDRGLLNCMMSKVHPNKQSQVLISVFTTSFKSKHRIRRPLRSLLAQTYTNFEWIIVDDTGDVDGGENWKQLQEICATDFRFRAFKPHAHSGNIGALKRDAAMLCKGDLLVELDHDDDIHPSTFHHLLSAFEAFPNAGMFWTDFCEVMETTDENWKYLEFFAFGYGCYSKQLYQGKWRIRLPAPPLNAKTLRYIIGVPNHLRVWSAKAYREMGGHSAALHVADDYELIVRTFVRGYDMVRIPRLCYVQYRNDGGNNFTFIRNAEIQKLTKEIARVYYEPVSQRLSALGMTDFNGTPNQPSWLFEDAQLDKRADKVHVPDGFVSIVVVVEGHHRPADVQLTLDSLQGLGNVEIIVVARRVPWLEPYMMTLTDERIQWWNLEDDKSGETLEDTRRYATKMLAIGNVVYVSPGEKY